MALGAVLYIIWVLQLTQRNELIPYYNASLEYLSFECPLVEPDQDIISCPTLIVVPPVSVQTWMMTINQVLHRTGLKLPHMGS
jgi:hypothetical protein